MTTLTVNAKGQITSRKDFLQHLGIRPGEKIELDFLPDGRGLIQTARPAGTIDGFVGLLAGRQNKVASIEEINTNVHVRAAVRDDPLQADVAPKVLTDAELIVVAMPCLCEFVSVLRGVQGQSARLLWETHNRLWYEAII